MGRSPSKPGWTISIRPDRSTKNGTFVSPGWNRISPGCTRLDLPMGRRRLTCVSVNTGKICVRASRALTTGKEDIGIQYPFSVMRLRVLDAGRVTTDSTSRREPCHNNTESSRRKANTFGGPEKFVFRTLLLNFRQLHQALPGKQLKTDPSMSAFELLSPFPVVPILHGLAGCPPPKVEPAVTTQPTQRLLER